MKIKRGSVFRMKKGMCENGSHFVLEIFTFTAKI